MSGPRLEDTPARSASAGDAIAERLLALGFLAALGVWMALAFAMGST